MIVGTVRELKPQEYRVALAPSGAHALARAGHTVLLESGAGESSGFSDDVYAAAGATLVDDAAEVWTRAEMVVKVKEPQPSEFVHFRPGLVLFTYLHLAAEPGVLDALIGARVTAIASETVQEDDGTMPLLAPMSEVAGRMAVEIGAQYLRKPGPGRGMLLGGVPGVEPAHVVVLGDGTVGQNAARQASALGAHVTLLGKSMERMRHLDDILQGRVATVVSTSYSIDDIVPQADLLVGAVLLPGERAPKLVSREVVRRMLAGSVIVDVAIDQGGCIETSHPTNHERPIYVEEGVVHYCVTNMPGAVPYTSTMALASSMLPYVEELANSGLREAVRRLPELERGVNTYAGEITLAALARSVDRPYRPLETLLA